MARTSAYSSCLLALAALLCVVTPAHAAVSTVLLNIPYRLERLDHNGYCGETSVSSICQFYGCWVSPENVRAMYSTAGNTQALVDSHMAAEMTRLRIGSSLWSSNAAIQSSAYLLWIKKNLAHRFPVIFVSYACTTNDPDYDHILPAIGFNSSFPNDFTTLYPSDVLFANSMMVDTPDGSGCIVSNKAATTARTFGKWVGTRASCAYDFSTGGCIPKDIDYGLAAAGVLDQYNVSLPTRLRMNTAIKLGSANITVVVQLFNMQAGTNYILVRYNNTDLVPATAPNADGFLSVQYEHACVFTSTAATLEYSDPFTVLYAAIYHYRLLNNAGVSNRALIPGVACSPALLKYVQLVL